MIDFHKFETFDPNGPGLGNLFGQISPFEALGIWPSGDFRLAPGDGAVPAAAYYLGAAFATVLLLYGIWACWRRRETVVLSGLAVAAVAYLAARVGGTAYTAAKAIEIAAPLCALTILLPLTREVAWFEMGRRDPKGTTARTPARSWRSPPRSSSSAPPGSARRWRSPTRRSGRGPTRPRSPACGRWSRTTRPSSSPRPNCSKTTTAPTTSPGSCAAAGSASRPAPKPPASRRRGSATSSSRARGTSRPSRACGVRKVASPYVLWEVKGPIAKQSVCPLIAVRQARQARR